MSTPFPQFYKAPADALDYGVNYSNWLSEGDVIESVTWTFDRGLVKQSANNTETLAIIWLTGGVDGRAYTVTCQGVTQAGRTKSQSFVINVQQT